jgi:hypothetical protein
MSKRILLVCLMLFALAAGSALAGGVVKGPFAGTVHADANLTNKDGSQVAVNWDRGQITALSGSSITLTRRDKAQVSFAITTGTAVRNDGSTYQLSDLKTGLVATVVSQTGTAAVIRNIRGDGAPGGADQSEFEGPAAHAVTGSIDAQYVDGTHEQFDYNRGRITALGNGSITVKRADGQSVTLSYDSNTLVRDQGSIESVDDLEVGEGAMFFSQGGLLKLVRCVGKGADGAGRQAGADRQAAIQARQAKRQAAIQANRAAHAGATPPVAAAAA